MIQIPVNYQKEETIPYVEIYNVDDSILYYADESTRNIKFYVDGHEINIEEYRLSEGYTTILYEIYDEENILIGTGQKVLLFDKTPPVIHCFLDTQPIEDVVYVEKDQLLTLSIDDISEVKTNVYLDDAYISLSDGKIPIQASNSTVYIECIDSMNHVSTKTIQIESIQQPEIQTSQSNNSYSTVNTVTLSTDKKDVNIDVYKDGDKIDSFLLDETKKYTFLQPGQYELQSRYTDIPYLKWNTLTLLYTNIQPSIFISTPSDASNQDMEASVTYQGDHVTNVIVKVNGNVVENGKPIYLSAIENERVSYTMEAYIEDAFHQVASAYKTVYIDRIQPSGYFTFQNQKVENSVSFIDLEGISFVPNKELNAEAVYLYKGKEYRDISLEQMLQMMDENSTMESIYTLTDEVGNTNTISMTWNKLKKVLQTVDEQTRSGLDVQNAIVYERIWEEDENHNLVIKQHKVTIKDTIKPKVRILKNNQLQYDTWNFNDICRITIFDNNTYSKDQISYLCINGKEIKDFQMDDLGNMYYEFKVKHIRYVLDIEAVDAAGNVTKVHKTIYRFPKEVFGLFILLILVLWRHREKGSRTE